MLNTIIRGDAVEQLKVIPAGFVDFTLFSPPYDKIRSYTDGFAFDIDGLGKELYRVHKEDSVCAVVIGDGTVDGVKSLTSHRLVMRWANLFEWNLFEHIIYKRGGRPGVWWKNRFRVDHENIFLFLKGNKPRNFYKDHLKVPSKHAGKTYSGTDRLSDGSLRNIKPKKVNDEKCRGTVWYYPTSNSECNSLKLQHPATFPDKLAWDLIMCFAQSNAVVLDPMCGSGTTLVQAKKLKCSYIGIDISRKYCDIAEERLKLIGT